MRSYERLSEPAPDVLMMVGLAVGMWAAIGVVALGVWPRPAAPQMAAAPPLAIEEHVATLFDMPVVPDRAQAQIHSPTPTQANPPDRRKVKVKPRKRAGPSLAVRIFSPRNSVN